MDTDSVVAEAARAKAGGATRFCMGAAWRDLKDRDVPKVAEMIAGVKALGLETCATLGMLTADQARALRDAGLDYYNHNLDTSPEYYGQVVTTRTYQERPRHPRAVRAAGMSTCVAASSAWARPAATAPGCCKRGHPAVPSRQPADQRLEPVKGTPLGGSTPVEAWSSSAHRGRPHRLSEVGGAAVSRPRAHEPRAAGALLFGRRQLHLHRRQDAHHRQPRRG